MHSAEQIRGHVEEKAGNPVTDIRAFATGNNTTLYLVDIKGGDRLVAKVAEKGGGSLDIEGWMLRYLAENSDLPVPDIIYVDPDMLIMSYIPSAGVLSASAEQEAAVLLAGLHAIRGDHYGLERDTLIGPLTQPNNPEKDWIVFFRDHRLLYMAKAALEKGRIDKKLMQDIEHLAGRLERYIDNTAPPSLLHGDVWGGNVLAVADKITGFIDPAIYYGDPEIELAFSTLFGTFGDIFFERYNEIIPLRDGFFEVRRDLYNLYPLLVHTRLFGGGYAEQVKHIVKRLAA